MAFRLSFVVPLTVLLLLTHDASALGNVEGEIAAEGGFIAAPGAGRETPLGPGGGLRGGVSIHNFYIGLDGIFYQGNPSSLVAFQGGLETGYGFRLADGLVTLRPQVGTGALVTRGGVTNGVPESRVASAYYCEPGITVLVTFPSHVFIGTDIGVLVAPGGLHESPGKWTTLVALAGHAQFGIKF